MTQQQPAAAPGDSAGPKEGSPGAKKDKAPTDDTKASEAPAGQGWLQAVDRYRDVAKWAIGAFAAMGALLAGTAPLAGLGRVGSDRLGFLLAGAVLGLLGVGSAIVATVASLVPRTVYWHEIKAKKQGWFAKTFLGLGPLENNLDRHPESLLPPGVTSLSSFVDGITKLRLLVARTAAGMTDATKSKAVRDLARREYEQASSYLSAFERSQERILLIGRFEKARTGFRSAMLVMVGGALATGLGLALLLYGLNDKTAQNKATAEVEKLKADTEKVRGDLDKTLAEAEKLNAETVKLGATGAEPSQKPAGTAPRLTFRLTPKGQAALGASLGAGCVKERVEVLVLSGDSVTGVWEVATLPAGDCRSARLTLNPDLALIQG